MRDLLDPGQIGRNLNVDTGYIYLTATNTPGHNANHIPDTITLADQRTTTVTLAGILALLAAGTNEARIELVAVAQASVAQLRFALMMRENWYIDFL